MKIIDAHTHIGSCMSAIHFSKKSYSVEELINEMDQNCVDRSVVMGGGKPYQIMHQNELIKKAVKEYPERLIGFARINPVRDDYFIEILKNCISQHHFRGVKLHPTQDAYPLLDYRVFRVIEEAIKLNVPVIIHSGSIPYAMPGQIADLAALYPESKIIMAHAGKLELWQHTLPSAKRVNNLYLEFSFTHLTSVREAIDAIGEKRVLYGSNWPAGSMRPWIEGIKKVHIFTKKEKELFLGKNFLSIIEDSLV